MKLRLLVLAGLLVFAAVVAVGAQTQYGVFTDLYKEFSVEPTNATQDVLRENAGQNLVSEAQNEAETVEESNSMKDGSKDLGPKNTYRRVSEGYFNVGELEVSTLSATAPKFSLFVVGGAHSGAIEGTLSRSGPYATSTDVDECVLRLHYVSEKTVEVTADDSCRDYAGMGAWFDGTYIQDAERPAASIDWVFENTTALTAFKKLVGSDLERFALTAHYSSTAEDAAPGIHAHELWVRGLAPYRTSVVMYGDDGRVWAAVFAEDTYGENNEIWYYTNVSADRLHLPQVIESWADNRFEEYTVIYKNG